MADAGHHREGQHDQRNMPVPAMPRASLVMIEAELILCGLEAVFDRPSMPFDADQRLHRGAPRRPCGEEGQITIGNIASDQQAPGPDAAEISIKLASICL